MADADTEREAIVAAVEAVAERIAAERSYLTDLDSAIGDADHGGNVTRGFEAAAEQVRERVDEEADVGTADLVQAVGRALISEVGGAAGPLYGGSIMTASQELESGLTAETTVAFAEAYLEKLQERGKAEVGAKTMVDAVTPAVHTYKKSIEHDDLPPLTALSKAVDAAERGVRFTTPLRAKKGRASYLGWRSVGHQDPGATSTLFVLEALLDVAEEYLEGEVDRDATSPTVPDEDPEEAETDDTPDAAADGGGDGTEGGDVAADDGGDD